MGKQVDGTYCYAQVTAGGDEAVRIRRRKLEKVPWHFEVDKNVLVLQLTSTPNPANRRAKLFWFRVHRYDPVLEEWAVDEKAVPIPKEWFTAMRGARPV